MIRLVPAGTHLAWITHAERLPHAMRCQFHTAAGCLWADVPEYRIEELARAAGRWPLASSAELRETRLTIVVEHFETVKRAILYAKPTSFTTAL